MDLLDEMLTVLRALDAAEIPYALRGGLKAGLALPRRPKSSAEG